MSNLNKIRYILAPIFVFLMVLSPIFSTQVTAQIQGAAAQPVRDDTHINVTKAEARRKGIKDMLDAAAIIAANIAIQKIVNSTITWAQSGFEGNPAYAVNPEQYFRDLANGIAGEFIEGSDLAFLCSPFKVQIQLAIRNQYLDERQFQCTFTEVVGNLENFYNDFNEGGWDAWFVMTQNSDSNPYGTYIDAKIELDSRLQKTLGLEKEQLDWNQGFLSWKVCDKNSPTYIPERKVDGKVVFPEACGPYDKITQTPGATIKSQLDKVLPSGLEKLINVQQVDQLVEAFATGILQRYVFGPEGLFKKGNSRPIDTAPNPESVYNFNPSTGTTTPPEETETSNNI